MQSLKELYKIGNGPSSSHTMGPTRAAKMFLREHPSADSFKIILMGSLASTGIGHLTDKALINTFAPYPVEIIFDTKTSCSVHPNTMDIYAYENGNETDKWRVYSVGGGEIRVEGKPLLRPKDIYPHTTFALIKRYCIQNNMRLWEYVEEVEGKEIWVFLSQIWNTMLNCIDEGLHTEGILPGPLGLERKAKWLFSRRVRNESQEMTETRIVSAYSYAVMETNAGSGIIVTAPTCGASGILPAVLKYRQQRNYHTHEEMLHALATAGLIGNLIKSNASISGSECGCQAEIGSACSMAAAALAELDELPLEQVEYAAEIAMEHHLGLTCDPIFGIVQIPCIERNAVAAMRAITAENLSSFLAGTRKISFDMVVETMYRTGKDLCSRYRETSKGGLASMYATGKTTHRTSKKDKV